MNPENFEENKITVDVVEAKSGIWERLKKSGHVQLPLCVEVSNNMQYFKVFVGDEHNEIIGDMGLEKDAFLCAYVSVTGENIKIRLEHYVGDWAEMFDGKEHIITEIKEKAIEEIKNILK